MIWKYIIGISSQPMYSWTQMALSNWEIWMFLKLPRKYFYILKLALHTMLVPKYGKINLMIQNLISGLLVVYFMKWLHSNPLSEQKIWMVFTKRLWEVIIQKYLQSTVRISAILSEHYYKFNPTWDHLVIRFCNYQPLSIEWMIKFLLKKREPNFYYKLSGYREWCTT